MNTKTRLMILAKAIMAAGLITCSGPSAPDLDEPRYDNPYDERSDDYIPTADLNTRLVSGIRALGATSGGVFETDYGKPVTSKGVCWSTEEEPTIGDECSDEGGKTTDYESQMTGLELDQTYYVRAYATNEAGTIYGGQRSFTTRDGIPILTTNEPFDIMAFSAKTGGNISDDGGAEIIARGICYVEGSGEPGLSDRCVEEGPGTGSFEVLLEDLSPHHQYTVRAYAMTEYGTSWGNQEIFTAYTEIVEVTNPATGRVWMDRNLGAGRAATSSTDSIAYGDLYQWGRAVDGHQLRKSPTTSTLSDSDQPDHDSFILAPNSPYDWRSTQNDDLWQGVNGINNPCPPGYRLPTVAEWEEEIESWDSKDASGAFASPLKLPLAGRRDGSDGSLYGVGTDGHYWSSSVLGSNARRLYFVIAASILSSRRAYGSSVRCIKD